MHKRRSKRLNLKVALLLPIVLAILAGGGYGLHQFQVGRTARKMLDRAKTSTNSRVQADAHQRLEAAAIRDPENIEILRRLAGSEKRGGTPTAAGAPVRRTSRRLLRPCHVGRRTARKKKTMGHPPHRNAQFENIARLRQEYLEAGDPVLRIDTKKKELLGNFHRPGQTFTQQTVETYDHDFGSVGKESSSHTASTTWRTTMRTSR